MTYKKQGVWELKKSTHLIKMAEFNMVHCFLLSQNKSLIDNNEAGGR